MNEWANQTMFTIYLRWERKAMDDKRKEKYEKEKTRIVCHIASELQTTHEAVNIIRNINSIKEKSNNRLVKILELENKISKIIDCAEELKSIVSACEYEPVDEDYNENDDKCENCEREYDCPIRVLNKIIYLAQ